MIVVVVVVVTQHFSMIVVVVVTQHFSMMRQLLCSLIYVVSNNNSVTLYNFNFLGADDTEHSSIHEPIAMDGYHDHIKYDYYNHPNVSFTMNPNFSDPHDLRMVMIRQINDDGKEWSEEDISDLETDAQNATLPPPSILAQCQTVDILL